MRPLNPRISFPRRPRVRRRRPPTSLACRCGCGRRCPPACGRCSRRTGREGGRARVRPASCGSRSCLTPGGDAIGAPALYISLVILCSKYAGARGAMILPPGADRAPGGWARGVAVGGAEGQALYATKGVRLAQNVQVGPCIPVRIQLETAEVGPTSGPTRRLSHLPL